MSLNGGYLATGCHLQAHRLELQQAEAVENAQHPTVRSGKIFGQKSFSQKVRQMDSAIPIQIS